VFDKLVDGVEVEVVHGALDEAEPTIDLGCIRGFVGILIHNHLAQFRYHPQEVVGRVCKIKTLHSLGSIDSLAIQQVLVK